MNNYEAVLRDRNRWVIRLRFVVIAVLCGNYILGVPLEHIWYRTAFITSVGILAVAANIIWYISVKTGSLPLKSLAYYQCIFDLVAVSLVVYRHGSASAASFLYVIVIMTAGILLDRRGILLVAFASLVMYLLFLLMEMYGYSAPLPPPTAKGGFYLLPHEVHFLVDVAIKGFFFFLIALSCAHLQELLTKMTKESEFLANFNSQVIGMIPVGVMVFNPMHHIEIMNPAMERTALLGGKNSVGKHLSEVFPNIDSSWKEAIERVETSGEEVRLLGAILPVGVDKSIRVNARLQPLKLNDQVLATVCTVQSAAR